METTFQYKGVTFRVTEDCVGTSIDAEYVVNLLYPGGRSDREFRRAYEYGFFLSTVTQEGEGTITVPSLDGGAEAIRAFYPLFLKLPVPFRTAWNNARAALLVDANASELTPGIEEKKEGTPTTAFDDSASFTPSSEALNSAPELSSASS